MDEKTRANTLVKIAQEVKAEEIILFHFNGTSSVTDYILICQGRSQGHVKGIADRIQETLGKNQIKPLSIEGYSEGSWVLMDYGTVIVHIFHPETRAYYQLEALHKNVPSETF